MGAGEGTGATNDAPSASLFFPQPHAISSLQRVENKKKNNKSLVLHIQTQRLCCCTKEKKGGGGKDEKGRGKRAP